MPRFFLNPDVFMPLRKVTFTGDPVLFDRLGRAHPGPPQG